MTHTYAELEISRAAWDEIAQKLRAAGYDHAFVDENTIDMHGIGLTPAAAPPNMVKTPEGQLLFRYPERPQAIDVFISDRVTVHAPLTLDPAGFLGEAPARPITPSIFDKAGQ